MNLVLAMALVLLGACGKKTEKQEPPPVPVAADAASAAVDAAEAIAIDAAPAAPLAIDVCSFVKRDDIEKLNPIAEESLKSTPPSDTSLGGCEYTFPNRYIFIHARPAAGFEAAIEKGDKELEGIGEKAFASGTGVIVKLTDKPYYLDVVVHAGEQNPDVKTASRLAKLYSLGAK